MTSKLELKWSDLVSQTLSPNEYLNKFGDKATEEFVSYEPKSDTLEELIEFLEKNKEKLRIVALGAEWCPDCSRNVPRMIKIVNILNSDNVSLQILYGIMVNALHKPGEPLWHKKRSPPEATDPKFDLKAIPSFYFFNDIGDYLGIIVENPEDSSTLEEDILKILKGSI